MKHLLRFCLFALFAVAALSSCRSTQKAISRAPVAPLPVRLSGLQMLVQGGPLASPDNDWRGDVSRVFTQELHHNMLDLRDTTRRGYIRLEVLEVNTASRGRVLHALQGLTLLTPSLLGVPLGWCETTVKVEVAVLDAQGEVLASYTGAGQGRVRMAMYHGYSQAGAARLADVKAVRAALAQIRPQLETDAERLNAALDTRSREEQVYNRAALSADSATVAQR